MIGDVIDVWMQHPTLRHSNHAMFESLRRWAGIKGELEEPLPLEVTIATMDEGNVDLGLMAAWYGPEGSLISNDDVAEFVARYPERLRAVADADLRSPMEAVRDIDYMKGRGCKKVLFGTNYPMLSAARALSQLDRLSLDPETRELFLAGNASRVFKL